MSKDNRHTTEKKKNGTQELTRDPREDKNPPPGTKFDPSHQKPVAAPKEEGKQAPKDK
jgi:hypothetical protein